MTISFVVAMDENNGIGKNNQLPWHLPADLKHFKELTIGHPIIMGRKTFDSIQKPLPKRRNIVVSHQDLRIEGCEIAHSIEEAIDICKDEEQVAIVGGAKIFEQSMDIANVIYLTRIHHIFDSDAFFPPIKADQWKELEKEHHEPDEKNRYPYSFITYVKA